MPSKVEIQARRLVREVYASSVGVRMQWLILEDVQRRLGINDQVVRDALRFAMDQRWLASQGNPPRRVAILEEGLRLA